MMNDQERADYVSYLKTKGFNDSDAEAYLQHIGAAAPKESLTDKALSLGGAALHGAGRVLDYAGGNVRNALMQGADAVADTGLTKEGDTMKALKGEAPSSSEYLQRAGMEPGLGNTGAGIALDIATDPLTYATLGVAPLLKGAGAAAKMGRLEKIAAGLKAASETKGIGSVDRALAVAQNPLELLTPQAGKSFYKSAFTPTETKIAEEVVGGAGKKPISDVLLDAGFSGNMSEALQKTRDLNRAAGNEIGAVTKAAGEKGITSSAEDAFGKSREYVDSLKNSLDPDMKNLGTQMETYLNDIVQNSGGEFSPETALQLKKQIDQKISAKGWKLTEGGGAKDKTFSQVAQDLKNNAIQGPIKEADSGLYDALKNANSTFAATDKTVQKDLLREAKNASKRKSFSAIDAMLVGGGAYNPMVWAALGAKKAGQAVMSTQGKTSIGKAMMSPEMAAVNKYMTDPAARRAVIDLMKEKP